MDKAPQKRLNPLQLKKKRLANQKKISKEQLLALCEKYSSLEEIALSCNCSTLTISIQLERLFKKGELTNLSQFVNTNKQARIEETLLSPQGSSLKKVNAFLKNQCTEEEIRLVRGHLFYTMQQEHGGDQSLWE